MNCGLADVGVVVDLPTDFWPLGVRSRCGGCCCRIWLPSAGLFRAYSSTEFDPYHAKFKIEIKEKRKEQNDDFA